ncbi:TonB-dependent receptor plug domain-containing protein [Asticcacaulis machinosus]|uniref:TonB-dependent receptor n=1 Tax=Asticcacaulis machinosus TaxID=2984211 RepID=A0ABT5HMG9_9CAUL|nr:TonB-dependent receptor [Asticcacaulis machinosus]MDC7677450.1 TonB-dependent receptor [Asticcacaulis machinosus]
MKRRPVEYKRLLLASSIIGVLTGSLTISANAQETTSETSEVTEVVVTGSRFGRVVAQSATPIDLIRQEDLERVGSPELKGKLRTLVPSFSITNNYAAGVNDFMANPSLRGLSTGHVLLLLNGKRRVTSATGGGDVAYDINAIPSIALSRVEVLRDGAGAQYGSDAIAGVINLGLDDTTGFKGEARYGETSKGDGEAIDIGLSYGLPILTDGVLRVSFMHSDHTKTDRATPDTRQQYFGSNGTRTPSANYGSGTGLTPSNGTLDPREATIDRNMWVSNDPEYINNALFFSAKLPVSEGIEAYSFGGINKLTGNSYNFFRRAGQDETVRSIYPDGFLPLQIIEMENHAAAAGIKGDDLFGFSWDLSVNYGKNQQDFGYENAANVSQGAASKTTFYRGQYAIDQTSFNFDVTREIEMGASPLKFAMGLEYREENYNTSPGEPDSYAFGGVPILDGPNAGRPAPAGAQPGGGIRPDDALDGSRDSKALYVELDKTFFDRWQVIAAGRHEDFSDFGSTTNYKMASRFEINDHLALRGSVGTGFRAPSLAQSYFSRTNVTFINGLPVRVRGISVYDPVAPQLGAQPLSPEESEDVSAGMVFRFGSFTGAIDYYKVEVTDRIVSSSTFQGGTLSAFMAANGQPDVVGVTFLTNAVDTTTEGIDLTAQYRQDLGTWGALSATFAANFNETEIDRISGTPPQITALGINTTLFDLTQQVTLTDARPKDKQTLGLNWKRNKFNVALTATRYGEVSEVSLTGKTLAQVNALLPAGKYDTTLVQTGSTYSIIQTYQSDIVTDLDVTYAVTDHVNLTVGASNIFDAYPEKRIASTVASVATGTNGADNAGTLPYSYIAPYGTAGRVVYAKLSVKY